MRFLGQFYKNSLKGSCLRWNFRCVMAFFITATKYFFFFTENICSWLYTVQFSAHFCCQRQKLQYLSSENLMCSPAAGFVPLQPKTADNKAVPFLQHNVLILELSVLQNKCTKIFIKSKMKKIYFKKYCQCIFDNILSVSFHEACIGTCPILWL